MSEQAKAPSVQPARLLRVRFETDQDKPILPPIEVTLPTKLPAALAALCLAKLIEPSAKDELPTALKALGFK